MQYYYNEDILNSFLYSKITLTVLHFKIFRYFLIQVLYKKIKEVRKLWFIINFQFTLSITQKCLTK